jgi:hypothetical protein
MRFAISNTQRMKRLAPAASLLAVALALGGCGANATATSGPAAAFAQIPSSSGATVAFESVDGPPPQIFDRLVNLLDSEAKLRNVAVVSRQESAAYRVRFYLAAQVRGSKTSVAWVWDVYDRDQQRAVRLRGEESTGRAGGDAWAHADDLVLRRIAQAGLTGLGGVINGTMPSEPEPTAAPAIRGNGPAMADAGDVAPAQMALGFSQR